MMGFIVKKVLGTVLGRWVTGGVVALLLGGAGLMWHNHKADLREEGRQECVQAINEETVKQLEDALAAEKLASAELVDQLRRVALENASAVDRRLELETSLTALADEMERQRNEDPEYEEWGDAPLPSGVADRVRDQAATGYPSPLRDESH